MELAFQVFGDVRFERLADISVSHLYNLRGNKQYQNKRRHWTKTNPTGTPIGKRRAPQPNGIPGYIRIDSVHQGDQDSVKGVYHINAVDCVTQMQYVAPARRSVRRICCRSSNSYWKGFRVSFSDSIRITARSISTTRSRNCWRNCWLNSPSHGPVIPTIMHWQNPRTHRWCVSILAMRIFRNTAPVWSMPSVLSILTLTSTFIARASSRKQSQTTREKSARNTATRT